MQCVRRARTDKVAFSSPFFFSLPFSCASSVPVTFARLSRDSRVQQPRVRMRELLQQILLTALGWGGVGAHQLNLQVKNTFIQRRIGPISEEFIIRAEGTESRNAVRFLFFSFVFWGVEIGSW